MFAVVPSCYDVNEFLMFYQGIIDPTGTETFAKGPKLALNYCGS